MYCETTRHERKVHFKTSSAEVAKLVYKPSLAAVTVADWATGATPLEGHSGYLPEATDTVGGAFDSTPFADAAGTRYFNIGPDSYQCDDPDGVRIDRAAADAQPSACGRLPPVWALGTSGSAPAFACEEGGR